MGFPGGSEVKLSACNAGDLGSIPGSGRSPGEMATHSSILAWKIPWMEEPGGLQSTGLQCWTRLSDFTFFFQSLLKLMSIESVMASNHPILCRPLLLPPSIFPSIRVFSNEPALRIRWPKSVLQMNIQD